MLAAAADGTARAGDWLVAEAQTSGRGRQGRSWVSPPGNLYASGLVELRADDPPAPTLALVAGVALHQSIVAPKPSTTLRRALIGGRASSDGAEQVQPWPGSSPSRLAKVCLKWPNDLLAGDAKIAGILLERQQSRVVIGIGVNLAHHPRFPDRPTTSLAALGLDLAPGDAIGLIAKALADWLAIWRTEGLPAIRTAWLARAHPIGTPLAAALPDDTRISGSFDGLTPDCALQLRLANGEVRVIHAGDVFLI